MAAGRVEPKVAALSMTGAAEVSGIKSENMFLEGLTGVLACKQAIERSDPCFLVVVVVANSLRKKFAFLGKHYTINRGSDMYRSLPLPLTTTIEGEVVNGVNDEVDYIILESQLASLIVP